MIFTRDVAFLRVPKTASTSIQQMLLDNVATPAWIHTIRFKEPPRPGVTVVHGEPHVGLDDARDVMAEFGVDARALRAILVVVRNPYDWEVSSYNYVRQRWFTREDLPLLGNGSFEAYAGRDQESPFPQYLFLDGRIPENLRLLRMESLESDLQAELARLGIEPRSPLPHLNRSRRLEDFTAYYSRSSEAAVHERHRLLFDLGLYPRMAPPERTVADFTPVPADDLPVSGPVELTIPSLGWHQVFGPSPRIRAGFSAQAPLRGITIRGTFRNPAGSGLALRVAGREEVRHVPAGPFTWASPLDIGSGERFDLDIEVREHEAGTPVHGFRLLGLEFSGTPAGPPVSGPAEVDGLVRGIHPDGWTGKTLRLHVSMASPMQVVRLSGRPIVPGMPTSAVLRADGMEVRAESSTGGAWEWTLPRPLPVGRPVVVSFEAERAATPESVGVGSDRRPLWLHAPRLEFVSTCAASPSGGSGIEVAGRDGLGSGIAAASGPPPDLTGQPLDGEERQPPSWEPASSSAPDLGSPIGPQPWLIPRRLTRELPKVLHTVWVGGEPPFDVTESVRRFLALNPGWEHRHWDNKRMREFPEVAEALARWPEQPVIAADLLRLLVVERHGGLYADLDYAWQEPMAGLDLVPLPWVGQHLRPDGSTTLVNGIFAAMPGDRSLGRLIERARAVLAAPKGEVRGTLIGPPLWRRWADEGTWCILPDRVFSPIPYSRRDRLAEVARGAAVPGAVAVHLYVNSWVPGAGPATARLVEGTPWSPRRAREDTHGLAAGHRLVATPGQDGDAAPRGDEHAVAPPEPPPGVSWPDGPRCTVPRRLTRELPKVLHTVWVGGEPPFDVTESVRRFLAVNPGWEHRHWDNAAAGAFPEAAEALARWPAQPVIAADLLRLLVVERHGGLYADLDYAWQEPMAGLDLVPLPWVSQHPRADGQMLLANGIFAAMPGDRSLVGVIERARAVLAAPWPEPPGDLLGPPFWSLQAGEGAWCILPDAVFHPVPAVRQERLAAVAGGETVPGAVAVQLFLGSWHPDDGKRTARIASAGTPWGAASPRREERCVELATVADLGIDGHLHRDWRGLWTAREDRPTPGTTQPGESLDAAELRRLADHTYVEPESRFVVFALPKAASTLLRARLNSWLADRLGQPNPHPWDRDASPYFKPGDLGADGFLAALSSPEWRKATLVRDPFSRLLAIYLHLEGLFHTGGKPWWVASLLDELGLPCGNWPAFDRFARAVCAQPDLESDMHWRSQVGLIPMPVQDLTFVGRFERLEEDFWGLLRHVLGEPGSGGPADGLKIQPGPPRTGASDRLTGYYTAELARLVSIRYEEDFSRFGYPSVIPGLAADRVIVPVSTEACSPESPGWTAAGPEAPGAGVALSTIQLDPDLVPPRPAPALPSGIPVHSAAFDRRTLVHDLFRDRDGYRIHALGPKPPGMTDLSFADAGSSLVLPVDARPGDDVNRVFHWVIQAGPDTSGIEVRCGAQRAAVPVQPNLAGRFAGRRVLFTMSKDNRLEWIADWARYHVHHFGVDAVLLYDNGSEGYAVEDVRGVLADVPGLTTSLVVEWPFPFGHVYRGGRAGFWAKPAFFEHAHRRFLADAEWALNLDVDELLVQAGDVSLDDWIAGLPPATAGITFPRFNVVNRTERVVDEPRHRHYWWRDTRLVVWPKYLVFPRAGQDGARWQTHEVEGDHGRFAAASPAEFLVVNQLPLLAGWQEREERQAPVSGSDPNLVEDLVLRERLRVLDDAPDEPAPPPRDGGDASLHDGEDEAIRRPADESVDSPSVEVVVSVLLPTRGRPELLRRSVASLLDRASAAGRVEVLLAVDADDRPTLDVLPDLPAEVRSVVMPRLGYLRIHEYVNELWRLARGRWTLLWNDDMVMETEGWDGIVAGLPDCVGQLEGIQDHNVAPLVPRAWLEALGHYSLHTHLDTWWVVVGNQARLRRKVPIRFVHDRFDLTGNNRDQTYAERDYGNLASFRGEENMALIQRDARTIRGLVAAGGSAPGRVPSGDPAEPGAIAAPRRDIDAVDPNEGGIHSRAGDRIRRCAAGEKPAGCPPGADRRVGMRRRRRVRRLAAGDAAPRRCRGGTAAAPSGSGTTSTRVTDPGWRGPERDAGAVPARPGRRGEAGPPRPRRTRSRRAACRLRRRRAASTAPRRRRAAPCR